MPELKPGQTYPPIYPWFTSHNQTCRSCCCAWMNSLHCCTSRLISSISSSCVSLGITSLPACSWFCTCNAGQTNTTIKHLSLGVWRHWVVPRVPWLSNFSTWFLSFLHCCRMLLVSCSRACSQDWSRVSLQQSPASSSLSKSTYAMIPRFKSIQTLNVYI